jgi:hypothetical protein
MLLPLSKYLYLRLLIAYHLEGKNLTVTINEGIIVVPPKLTYKVLQAFNA